MNAKRIGVVASGALIALALIFDIIQGFLTLTVIGSAVSFFVGGLAWIIFLIWFALLGTNYLGRGAATRLFTMITSVIVELVPFLNTLPGLTVGVIALIVSHNKEVSAQATTSTSISKTRADARRDAILRNRARRKAANDNALEKKMSETA